MISEDNHVMVSERKEERFQQFEWKSMLDLGWLHRITNEMNYLCRCFVTYSWIFLLNKSEEVRLIYTSFPLSFELFFFFGESAKIIQRKYSKWRLPFYIIQFSSVQLLNHVRVFATPWIAARQAPLSITNSQSSLRLTSIELVMPSSHLILCHPLLLLPPIPPSIRVFSNESTLCMRWPKYWSFIFSIIPSKEHPGLISFRMDWRSVGQLEGKIMERWKSCTTFKYLPPSNKNN